MNRVAIVTVLVLAGVAIGAATATAQVEPPVVESTPATDPGNASQTNDTSNVSLGASISAFMQSNSERATQAVDQGMWSAAFDRSDHSRQRALARSHVETLRERLDALAEQRQDLIAAYRNGSVSRLTFQARMSALGERYRAIAQSVDDTKRALDRENVDVPGLAELDRSLQRGAAAVAASNASLPANVTIPGFDRGPTVPLFDDNRTSGQQGDAPGESDGGQPSVNTTSGDFDGPAADENTTTR